MGIAETIARLKYIFFPAEAAVVKRRKKEAITLEGWKKIMNGGQDSATVEI
jgi:hypothetical protein